MTYDPDVVTYRQLLDVFWRIHDPTTLNRQGFDVGDQYRSAIFYHTPEQKVEAKGPRREQQRSGRFRKPIVTEVVAAGVFWRAEEYHQKYLSKRGGAACHLLREMVSQGSQLTRPRGIPDQEQMRPRHNKGSSLPYGGPIFRKEPNSYCYRDHRERRSSHEGYGAVCNMAGPLHQGGRRESEAPSNGLEPLTL